MTFEEMRLRLANRDAIREKQEQEERAEEQREIEDAARLRREVNLKNNNYYLIKYTKVLIQGQRKVLKSWGTHI